MEKKYDENLRLAMDEVSEVLKKRDCGGYVSLFSKSHGEYKLFIEHMTWSNVRFLKDGKTLHVKLHAVSDHENTESTVGMLMGIKDMAALIFQGSEDIIEQMKKHIHIEHTPFGGGINNDDRK